MSAKRVAEAYIQITPDELQQWVDLQPDMKHTAATTYVQITRVELEDWLDDIGFRGKWERDSRYAGIYLLHLSDTVAVKLSSSIGSKDDAMGRGQASMQLALVSRITGRVLNKKAQGQSHFARTTNWMKNWAGGVDTMKRTYQAASDFYDVIAVIDDRDKYRETTLKLIEGVPNWGNNNFFVSLHNKIDRGGVLMPNETREIEKALKAPAIKPAPPVAVPGPSSDEADALRTTVVTAQRVNALRALWKAVSNYSPPDERGEKNRTWVMGFAESIGKQVKDGRTLTTAQLTTLKKILDNWGIDLPSGKSTSTLF